MSCGRPRRGRARRTRWRRRSDGAQRARHEPDCEAGRAGAARPPGHGGGSVSPRAHTGASASRALIDRCSGGGRQSASRSSAASRSSTPSRPATYARPIPSCRGARSAHATAAGERTVNIAPSPFVAAAASCPRTERRTAANVTSERAPDATDRYEQTPSMNTTTQRRNKQARVATVSAPTIAEPPAETRPTPPDIQPCANQGLHRTITGIVTERPPSGQGVVGGGEARAVRALADGQGLDLKRCLAYSNGDETCRPSRRSATRWRSRRSVDCARGRSAAGGWCFGARDAQ